MGPAAFSQDDARMMGRMIADDGQDDFRENWSPKKSLLQNRTDHPGV